MAEPYLRRREQVFGPGVEKCSGLLAMGEASTPPPPTAPNLHKQQLEDRQGKVLTTAGN
jgi:hypothetical protein